MFEKDGFSLPEIILGIFILTGVLLIFSLSISSSTKESAFTANHFSSLMLSQKVGEDIIEEFAVNPFANETLILDHGQLRRESVVDGGSTFFITVEDRFPPWGRIDSCADGAINQKMQPLYEQVNGFQLMTSSSHKAFGDFLDETANLQKASVEFFWKNGGKKASALREFYVFSPRTCKTTCDRFPQPDYSSKTFENYFKLFFPGNENVSITEIINRYSINGRIAFEYASLVDAYEKLMQSPTRLSLIQEITAAGKILSSTSDAQIKFRQNLKLAKAYFKLAKVIFLSFAAAVNHLRIVTESPDAYSTIEKMSAQRVFFAHQRVIWLYNYFLNNLEKARIQYLKVLIPDFSAFIGKKEEQQIILRLIDVHRIFFISSPVTQHGFYRSFLSKLKQYSEWRNMYLFRFICQEELLIRDDTLLVNKFPNLQPLANVLQQDFGKVKPFIARHR